MQVTMSLIYLKEYVTVYEYVVAQDLPTQHYSIRLLIILIKLSPNQNYTNL